MQLDQNELMTIAMWLAVAENEISVSSYEYGLMAKLAAMADNPESAKHYEGEQRKALAYEAECLAEWEAEEAECYDAFGVNTKNSFNTPPKPN